MSEAPVSTPATLNGASRAYAILGIGSAILDIICHTDEAQIADLGLARGDMTLINEARAEQLYAAMSQTLEMSGGTVPNTVAALSSFGATTAHIALLRDDNFGDIIRHDLRAAGVHFPTPASTKGDGTGRCLIFVTPDGERTMQTYLGCASQLAPEHIDEALIANSRMILLAGYSWNSPTEREAMHKTFALAKKHQTEIAFSLASESTVKQHRDEFWQWLQNGQIDVLFGNRREICALARTNDFEEACALVRPYCKLTVLTRGSKGATLLTPNDRIDAPAAKVAKVVDTTGAGDTFSAGVLYGHLHGLSLQDSADLGARAAAQIIQQSGARPLTPLKALLPRPLAPATAPTHNSKAPTP